MNSLSDSTDNKENLSEELIAAGIAHSHKPKGLMAAVNCFRAAAVTAPSTPRPLLLLTHLTSMAAVSSQGYAHALRFNEWANITLPHNPRILTQRGSLHANMGRKDLSLPNFVRASELNPSSFQLAYKVVTTALELGEDETARSHLDICERLRPNDETVRVANLALNGRKTSSKPSLFDRFPTSVSDLSNMDDALSSFLLSKLDLPRVLRPQSKIFAAGSCFATNIADALKNQGYTAVANMMGESINSTLANREYIDWLLADYPEDTEISKLISKPLREKTRSGLLNSDIIVLTVGVAPVFLDRKTGHLRLQTDEGASVRRLLRECEFRTLSVEENVDNLAYILSTLRRARPDATIFVTLSPVPLNATFEYSSAIVADCVSKSVLRVAIDQIERRQMLGVYYWPAFEAVRWIGGYQGDAYGEYDGSTRHVSNHVIKAITSAFIERVKVDP